MPEDTYGSATQIIISIREGNRAKVTPLWERYFERLTHHAAKHLRHVPSGGDEDVALSAINAFCDGLAEGKFDYVDRREKLWATLATITERKARRIGKRFRREVLVTDLKIDESSGRGGVSRIAVVEPTEEYGDTIRMEMKDLIDVLPNPLWRDAVRLVMEGYTVSEIAAKMDRTRGCVHVWFRAIRAIWEENPGRENLLD